MNANLKILVVALFTSAILSMNAQPWHVSRIEVDCEPAGSGLVFAATGDVSLNQCRTAPYQAANGRTHNSANYPQKFNIITKPSNDTEWAFEYWECETRVGDILNYSSRRAANVGDQIETAQASVYVGLTKLQGENTGSSSDVTIDPGIVNARWVAHYRPLVFHDVTVKSNNNSLGTVTVEGPTGNNEVQVGQTVKIIARTEDHTIMFLGWKHNGEWVRDQQGNIIRDVPYSFVVTEANKGEYVAQFESGYEFFRIKNRNTGHFISLTKRFSGSASLTGLQQALSDFELRNDLSLAMDDQGTIVNMSSYPRPGSPSQIVRNLKIRGDETERFYNVGEGIFLQISHESDNSYDIGKGVSVTFHLVERNGTVQGTTSVSSNLNYLWDFEGIDKDLTTKENYYTPSGLIQDEINGLWYTTHRASWNTKFDINEIKAYIVTGVDAKGAMVRTEVTGGIIPKDVPVLLECLSNDPERNVMIPTLTNASFTSTGGNLLQTTEYNFPNQPAPMSVPAGQVYYTLGRNADGHVGFITQVTDNSNGFNGGYGYWLSDAPVMVPIIPVIIANPVSVTFTDCYATRSYTQSVSVTGIHLDEGITVTLNDPSGMFSVDPASFATSATDETLTVTYAPTAAGTHNATITLSSIYADNVVISLQGTAMAATPTLMVNPASLSFTTEDRGTESKTFAVTGRFISDVVNIALADPSGVFTVEPAAISATDISEDVPVFVTVTYTPMVAGTHDASVTLTSTGATNVNVPINGTAIDTSPTLIVSTNSLSFSVDGNGTYTKTFTVSGRYITDDVSIELTDLEGVYAIDPVMIPASSINAGSPVTVTVTFNAPSAEGSYYGQLAITSPGLELYIVNLTAQVNGSGEASDKYLNIAKYATIDQNGWNTSLVDNLYKFTPYENDGVAWLTLPVYGAFVGAKYAISSNTVGSGNPQQWISSDLTTTSNVNGGATWNASGIYMGSGNYFTSASSKYFGNSNTSPTAARTISFYVTNATSVRLLGVNNSNASGRQLIFFSYSYPTELNIYECTKNANGTLTSATTATKSFSNDTNNASINFEATGLDATKIYRVEASVTRGKLYEIGFQTSLPLPSFSKYETVTLAELVARGEEESRYEVTGLSFVGIVSDPDSNDQLLLCKDDNQFANPNKSNFDSNAMTDFMAMGGIGGTAASAMDESNWIMLRVPSLFTIDASMIDAQFAGVKGRYLNSVNPELLVLEQPVSEAAGGSYTPNLYIPASFAGTQVSPINNNTYFFVTPKPMEVANVKWAIWDGDEFITPPMTDRSNQFNLSGGFSVNQAYMGDNTIELEANEGYEMLAVIKLDENASGNSAPRRADGQKSYVVWPLTLSKDQQIITEVTDVQTNRMVASVTYYNVAGVSSARPFDGVNIVVTRYTDGSVTTQKVVR